MSGFHRLSHVVLSPISPILSPSSSSSIPPPLFSCSCLSLVSSPFTPRSLREARRATPGGDERGGKGGVNDWDTNREAEWVSGEGGNGSNWHAIPRVWGWTTETGSDLRDESHAVPFPATHRSLPPSFGTGSLCSPFRSRRRERDVSRSAPTHTTPRLVSRSLPYVRFLVPHVMSGVDDERREEDTTRGPWGRKGAVHGGNGEETNRSTLHPSFLGSHVTRLISSSSLHIETRE